MTSPTVSWLKVVQRLEHLDEKYLLRKEQRLLQSLFLQNSFKVSRGHILIVVEKQMHILYSDY